MSRKPMDSSAGTPTLQMAATASAPRNEALSLSVLSRRLSKIVPATIRYMDFLQKIHVTDLALMASP
jgi:hypothetical protein